MKRIEALVRDQVSEDATMSMKWYQRRLREFLVGCPLTTLYFKVVFDEDHNAEIELVRWAYYKYPNRSSVTYKVVTKDAVITRINKDKEQESVLSAEYCVVARYLLEDRE